MKTGHGVLIALLLCAPFAVHGQQNSVAILNDAIRRDLTLLGTALSAVIALLQMYYFAAGILACITRGDFWTATKYVLICAFLPSAIMSYLIFL